MTKCFNKRTTLKLTGVPLLLIAIAFLGACGSKPGNENGPGADNIKVIDTGKDCSSDPSVCNSSAGEQCVSGKCKVYTTQKDCSSDPSVCDASAGQQCIGGQCVIPAGPKDCPTECDAGIGEKCINGTCKVPANNCEDPDFHCTQKDYVCDPDANGCVLNCSKPTDVCNGVCCSDGEVCMAGACRALCPDGSLPCFVDAQNQPVCCGSNSACVSQQCITEGRSCSIKDEQYCVIEEFCDTGNSNTCIRYDSFNDPDKPLCIYQAAKVEKPELKLAWHQHIDKDGNILTDLSSHHKERDVMMTPIVGDLNGDKISDLVFTTQVGTLWAVSGKPWPNLDPKDRKKGNAETLWHSMGKPYHPLAINSTPALADLDGNGTPEIIAVTRQKNVVKINGKTGDELARSTVKVKDKWQMATVTIANLDREGSAEIIVGGKVFDSALNHLCTYSDNPSEISVAADINLNGNLEIVDGGRVYKFEKNGSSYDCSNIVDPPEIKRGDTAFSAVADFKFERRDTKKWHDTPQPEIVTVSNEVVYMTDHEGKLLWKTNLPDKKLIALPGTIQRGGAPNLANFDGDDSNGLEIGLADAVNYVVIKGDGSYLWKSNTEDGTSGMTGSSVFDFNGDGKADVAYADHNFLYIYDGAGQDRGPGKERKVIEHVKIPNRSFTLIENPAIADLEQDGHVDLVVPSCHHELDIEGIQPSAPGVRVFSSDKWVGSRSMWNQHGYHITNIKDDLTVPVDETPPYWTQPFSNNFRQNAQTTNLLAPNLQIELVSTFKAGSCQDATAREILFDIINSGAKKAPANKIKVALFAKKSTDNDYPTSPLVVTDVDAEIAPNERYRTKIDWSVPNELQGASLDIKLVVNPEALVNECKTDDNSDEVKKVPTAAANLVPKLGVINTSECTTNKKVKVSYSVENNGGADAAANSVLVHFFIYAATESTTPAAEVTIPDAIPAGGKYEGEVELNVDSSSSWLNTPLNVKMVVDPKDTIIECREEDNTVLTKDNERPVCINLG